MVKNFPQSRAVTDIVQDSVSLSSFRVRFRLAIEMFVESAMSSDELHCNSPFGPVLIHLFVP